MGGTFPNGGSETEALGVDIVVGCVDNSESAAAMAKCAEDWSEVDYCWIWQQRG